MRLSIRTAAVAAFVLAASGNVIAQSHDHDHGHDHKQGHDHSHDHGHGHDEVRHAGAHVHGKGELNFATEGSELHMELMMPAHDILGFETISTPAQQQQLDEALARLQSESIWSLPAAARCQLADAHASTTNENHDGHDHGHDHGQGHDSEAGGHMDIAATYKFKCQNISSLDQFATTLFETFPRSELIQVQGFTSSGQLSENMTPDQPQVRF